MHEGSKPTTGTPRSIAGFKAVNVFCACTLAWSICPAIISWLRREAPLYTSQALLTLASACASEWGLDLVTLVGCAAWLYIGVLAAEQGGAALYGYIVCAVGFGALLFLLLLTACWATPVLVRARMAARPVVRRLDRLHATHQQWRLLRALDEVDEATSHSTQRGRAHAQKGQRQGARSPNKGDKQGVHSSRSNSNNNNHNGKGVKISLEESRFQNMAEEWESDFAAMDVGSESEPGAMRVPSETESKTGW